ncbi:hypothetical protein V1264_011819 [Littorina saxatilis]|uniref:Transposase Tc1-like domain-containing protein n=1 Tax=Littorina saxatilis TaxID=31220 RepID=A0AAN9BW05_9CAEN
MPPRRKLSDLDRGRAIGWLQDGVAARQVAQRLAVAPSVIIRLKQRFHATGRLCRSDNVLVGPESPHKERIASFRGMPCNKDWLRQTTLGNTYKLPPTLLLVVRQSETAYTTLACVRARRPVRGTTLTANHRAARRAWCTQHVRWQRQQWAQVLFTDESRFCLEPADGRIRVWRRRGERFAEGAVLERQRFGGGSVMV